MTRAVLRGALARSRSRSRAARSLRQSNEQPSAKPAKSAVSFEPEPSEIAALEGPAPSGKSALEREQAVIALLRGQRPSNRFPVIATDDGGGVNPALRETLSPRTRQPVESPKGVDRLDTF